MPNVSIYTILEALQRYPHPIEYIIAKLPEIKECFVSGERFIRPETNYEKIDVRKFARIAYENYIKEEKEQKEKYDNLLMEFEDYKRRNREFEEFNKFKNSR